MLQNKQIIVDIRYIYDVLPNFLIDIVLNFNNNHILLNINQFKSNLFELLFLKKNQFLKFNMLIDLFAVDYLNYIQKKVTRFSVFYNLLSLKFNKRLILKLNIKKNTTLSICCLYSNANWLEREVWDMFGICFINNKDLRRILTDYGFDGHPLRKDFPLAGYIEVRYDDILKSIVYEKLELAQEFRLFDFRNLW